MATTPLRYRSLDALAAALGLPRTWLRQEADAGRLPCLRINGRRLFDIELVRQALTERQQPSEVRA